MKWNFLIEIRDPGNSIVLNLYPPQKSLKLFFQINQHEHMKKILFYIRCIIITQMSQFPFFVHTRFWVHVHLRHIQTKKFIYNFYLWLLILRIFMYNKKYCTVIAQIIYGVYRLYFSFVCFSMRMSHFRWDWDWHEFEKKKEKLQLQNKKGT